ncbi:hypothetical protein DPMN_042627 [Dreissena polymorpha]|uniref:Uncharacterized protein n=1 Tax=Dreissena polymorpha TaxID=45954 RepID=A0A9D4CZF7_DREPO|nr:hypothetical protein DPMN_042627 [Dreissena polymorpha]
MVFTTCACQIKVSSFIACLSNCNSGHVFEATKTILDLIQDIIGTNLLTKFHEDWKVNLASRVKNDPPPGGHVFQPTGIIFELVQYIVGMNLLTKFNDDRIINVEKYRTINVASRVLTRFYYSHIWKNATPLGSHVFQANVTIFELIHYIIATNLLQMLTPHNGRRTKGDHKSSP